jgi:hypothetical protein
MADLPLSECPSATTLSRLDAFLDAYDKAMASDADHDPVMARDQASLSQSLARMQVLDNPFTHAAIDRFLPDDLYRQVLAEWDGAADLAPVTLDNPKPDADGYIGSRKARLIDDVAADAPAGMSAATWARVSQALRAPAFVRALFTRFAGTIETNLALLGDIERDRPGFRLYLCRDEGAKEALGAHLDAMRKLLTIVIYLRLDGAVDAHSEEAWGTALYDMEPGSIVPLHFTPNADHKRVARIGFVPNRAFVMPNDRRALHGVAGGQADVVRRTLMCGYWLFTQKA